jgi:Putative restriction endonuclease
MSSTSTQSIPQGKIVLTYDDYCELPNDRNRYEILDGELSVTPAPRTKHQSISGHLYRILANHIVANQLGDIYAAPTDVILAPTTVVQPDLIVIGNDRRGIVTERAIEGLRLSLSRFFHPQLSAQIARSKRNFMQSTWCRTTGSSIPINRPSKPMSLPATNTS